MNKIILYTALLLIISSAISYGDEVVVNNIHIQHAWTRSPPGNSSSTGGYLTILNKGTEPDVLVGGYTSLAENVEIHEMNLTDGVMKMRPLKNGLPILPNKKVELKPGGLHLMLTNLSKPLTKGETIPVTLIFENAGEITINLDVAQVGAKEAPVKHNHSH